MQLMPIATMTTILALCVLVYKSLSTEEAGEQSPTAPLRGPSSRA